MDTIQKRFSTPKTEHCLYGKLLSKKLSSLPIELNLQAKHEIDNIMFKFSMQSIKYNQTTYASQNLSVNQQPLSTQSNQLNFTAMNTPASPQIAYTVNSNQKTPSTPIYHQNFKALNSPVSPEFVNSNIDVPNFITQDVQPSYTNGTTFHMSCMNSTQQGQ